MNDSGDDGGSRRLVPQRFSPYKQFVGIFIPTPLVKYRGLSLAAKFLWGRLAQYAGEKGYCWPSVDSLADELRLKRRQVFNLISELETGGFIERDPRPGKKTVYHFLFHPIFTEAAPPGEEDGETTRAKNCTPAQENTSATDCTPTRATDCTPPVQSIALGTALGATAGVGETDPEKNQEKNQLKESKIVPFPPDGGKTTRPRLDYRREEFKTFYETIYPLRVKRPKAEAAWEKQIKAGKLPSLEVLAAAVERQKKSKQWLEGVIPYPATWLNNEQWNDELPLPAAQEPEVKLEYCEEHPERKSVLKVGARRLCRECADNFNNRGMAAHRQKMLEARERRAMRTGQTEAV